MTHSPSTITRVIVTAAALALIAGVALIASMVMLDDARPARGMIRLALGLIAAGAVLAVVGTVLRHRGSRPTTPVADDET